MKIKKYAAFGVVFLILAGLIYLQFRTWRNFDWAKLFQYHLEWRHIVYGTACIYFSYFLRALRWKIFLRPIRKDVAVSALLPPTLIGFTGLALLGRPGELIRPYLIARRAKVPFASQVAVWAVERIFDVGGFAVLLVSGIFLPSELHTFAINAPPEVRRWIHFTGYAVIALVAVLFTAALFIFYRGNKIANWIENRFAHLSENLGHRIAHRIREFTLGLKTIHGFSEFLQLSAVSIALWWFISLAYSEVAHAYGGPLSAMSTSKVLLMMGASMIGSIVQLPGVGGGSQLGTISVLDHVFDIVPKELAVSCGIMIWLVTFVTVVPVGLYLSHHERLSLRTLSAETERAETQESARG
jgi:glycosyltransferase 2 family protein